MTPRPCTWPDGGCGEPVLFFPTGEMKPNGEPVLQVVDAKPEKRIVLVALDTPRRAPYDGRIGIYGPEVARVVDAYVDHHATCRTWLARVERERERRSNKQRAAEAGRP